MDVYLNQIQNVLVTSVINKNTEQNTFSEMFPYSTHFHVYLFNYILG